VLIWDREIAVLTCPHCQKRLLHVHRRLYEKLFYSDIYICSSCGRRVGARRASQLFLFSTHARCIQCGSFAVARLVKPDTVDPFTRNPLGRVQRFLGAPVYRCRPCRVQFYEWRPLRQGGESMSPD
jgi:DNA-directed RNA polymerase subunit RPC12/RpoP